MGLSPISYILIAVCTPIYLVGMVYIATQTFWKNSPFRSQNAYDKWFVARMENGTAAISENDGAESEDGFPESSNSHKNIYLEAINTGYSAHLPTSFGQGKPFGLM